MKVNVGGVDTWIIDFINRETVRDELNNEIENRVCAGEWEDGKIPIFEKDDPRLTDDVMEMLFEKEVEANGSDTSFEKQTARDAVYCDYLETLIGD